VAGSATFAVDAKTDIPNPGSTVATKKKTTKKKSARQTTRKAPAKKKTTKKRKRGRPALPPGLAREKVFCIRLTPSELDRIEGAARKKGLTSRQFAVQKLLRGL
jgi:hypothetical protein